MLNIEVNRSAEAVERYCDSELVVSDYLMKEPGVWARLGAERLGLRGRVRRRKFVALLRNVNITSGRKTVRCKNSFAAFLNTISGLKQGLEETPDGKMAIT